jgi:hypothetical protein
VFAHVHFINPFGRERNHEGPKGVTCIVHEALVPLIDQRKRGVETAIKFFTHVRSQMILDLPNPADLDVPSSLSLSGRGITPDFHLRAEPDRLVRSAKS